MRKIFFLSITLLVIGMSSVSAQAVWGLRAGMSRPTVTDYEGSSLKGKFGLEIGPVLYYSLKGNFYLNSGLMFSMKTIKDSYSGLDSEWGKYKDEYTLNISHLEIPLYIGYSIPIGKFHTYVQAGPYIGFNLSAKQKAREFYDGEYESYTENVVEYISPFNAGLGLVGGININRFKLEVGYQHGLIDINNDLFDTFDGSEVSIKLASLFFGVSYVF